ncbi:hypothetical protein L873DRAFT_1789378 [Choiromyces venosus 120613-1]|uniref:Hydrophobin n=1 Tax=Choiromyces venosus 120613-1 TaxID=1336337 RepID=A0A3N4JND3_9PEZI|nr:hypothetical protein L873DRAFT_1789378 [Choiromyces venosus 120613-1]
MVSIKSLAVILFAVAVSAAPTAHDGQSTNVQDNSQHCPEQTQELYCCNDARSSKATGIFTGVLDDLSVKCNHVPVDVWAVNAVSGQSSCDAKLACCTSKTKQRGVVNIDLGCVAFAGAN